MDSKPLHHSTSSITRMSADPRALCVVCGASAIGRNFDAYTCLSCKAFFRRNGYNEQLRYTCRVIGACEITIATRRHCSACRLNKCFQQGMKKELIRSLVAIQNSTASNLYAYQPARALTTMNHLSCSTRLSLSTDDWSLLTNVRNAYEEFCIQPFIQSHQTIPLNITMQPCRTRFKLQRFVDLKYKYLSVLASFIRRVWQFDPVLEQHFNQIKDNLKILLTLNTVELIKSNQLDHTPWEHDRSLFESVLTEQFLRSLDRNLQGYLHLNPYDPLIFKLFLIVLSLTYPLTPLRRKSHYQNEDFHAHPMVLVQHQWFYLTLLWKYVIYRLDSTHAQIYAVRFIQNILRRQTLEADMIDILANRDDHGQLVDLIETGTKL